MATKTKAIEVKVDERLLGLRAGHRRERVLKHDSLGQVGRPGRQGRSTGIRPVGRPATPMPVYRPRPSR